MFRLGQIFLALVAASSLLACSSIYYKPPQPVSVTDIVAMSRAGEPEAAIVEKIRNSGTVYRLNASQLADLRKQGVPDTVINYMQRTYLEAVRRNQELVDQSYWTPYEDGYLYGGYPFGWDNGWYPDEPYMYYPPDEMQSDQPLEQPGGDEDQPSE